MPDGTTYELYASRAGETGQSHARTRLFLINWPMHQALVGGWAFGSIPKLGDSFIFDTGTLYCGDHIVAPTAHPDWCTIDALYVRIGALRYNKLPGEPGYRHLSTTAGAGDVTVPYIQEVDGPSPGVKEYVTHNVTFKRRDTVALVTVNALSSSFTAATHEALRERLNFYIDGPDVGEGPWLFESFTTSELSDRVTQLVCAFRSSSTLEARPASESGGAFDVDIPELPPFSTYVIVPGPLEDFPPPIGPVHTKPSIITSSPYKELTKVSEIFGPTGFNILPIYQ